MFSRVNLFGNSPNIVRSKFARLEFNFDVFSSIAMGDWEFSPQIGYDSFQELGPSKIFKIVLSNYFAKVM